MQINQINTGNEHTRIWHKGTHIANHQTKVDNTQFILESCVVDPALWRSTPCPKLWHWIQIRLLQHTCSKIFLTYNFICRNVCKFLALIHVMTVCWRSSTLQFLDVYCSDSSDQSCSNWSVCDRCPAVLGVKLAKPSMENDPPVDRLCVGDVELKIDDALLWFDYLFDIDAILMTWMIWLFCVRSKSKYLYSLAEPISRSLDKPICLWWQRSSSSLFYLLSLGLGSFWNRSVLTIVRELAANNDSN